jgi:xylan 1,4-beta-xylosidase
VIYYNTRNHAYLHVTAHQDSGERVLRLLVNRDGIATEPRAPLTLAASGTVELGVDFETDRCQFRYKLAGGDWQLFGPSLPADFLSDEFACQQHNGFFHSFGFTGNFVGLACQDLAGTKAVADFDYFTCAPLGA